MLFFAFSYYYASGFPVVHLQFTDKLNIVSFLVDLMLTVEHGVLELNFNDSIFLSGFGVWTELSNNSKSDLFIHDHHVFLNWSTYRLWIIISSIKNDGSQVVLELGDWKSVIFFDFQYLKSLLIDYSSHFYDSFAFSIVKTHVEAISSW